MSPDSRGSAPPRPELVIGLVGAAGTDLESACETVGSAVARYGYQAVPIRLSRLMRELDGGADLERVTGEDTRIEAHMDAGDAIRDQANRNDAVAGLAITWMSEYRKLNFDGGQAVGTAFILNSLKHPEEIEAMRRIYRGRFIAISVHSPTDQRREALQARIAGSYGHPERADDYAAVTQAIMKRDEYDDDHHFGQNVREAFVLGHIYVSTAPASELADGIERYFRLFFGDPFETPTRDEYAMFQTHSAALRSADLSRQVGAAICSREGEIIAVGCNEVPRFEGGQYWPGEGEDHRDFRIGYDSNVRYRDAALDEAFAKLKESGLLAASAEPTEFMSALKGTRLANLTEFGRSMHAEMAAILDAARRGVPVAGARLFTTTFPCHNCARHIIGAGIREVVYREPYEKSLASELHKDAVVVDSTTGRDGKVVIRRFVGVGPPQFLALFGMRKRKNSNGSRVEWKEGTAVPHLITTEAAYLTNEEDFLDEFRDAIRAVSLKGADS